LIGPSLPGFGLPLKTEIVYGLVILHPNV
jgi:hypothetical protein